MPRKKTDGEFLAELFKTNPTLKPLEPYINNNTKIAVKCDVCSYVWKVLPRSILGGHGCPKCTGHIGMSTEDYIMKIQAINSSINVVGEYHGSSHSIDVECKKCGYKWSPVANSIIFQKTGCPNCAGNIKLTNEQFVCRVKEKNPHITLLSDYISSKAKVKCRCEKCGYEWEAVANSLMVGYGCSKCAGNLKKNHNQFVDELEAINPNVLVLDVYQNAKTALLVKCLNCNRQWMAKPCNLLNKEGCPQCAQRVRKIKQTKTEKDYISEVNKINPNITILGKYVNSHEKIKSRCNLCGFEWNPIAWDLIRGSGCPDCARTSTSYMEQFILLALQEVFGKEKVISRDTSTIGMELDVYLPSHKIAIEPGSWFWHSDKLEKDKEKRCRCKAAGIRLFTIYDSCNAKADLFDTDYFVYSYDIGAETDHKTLKLLVMTIVEETGEKYEFVDSQWRRIENEAHYKSMKISTSEFISRLSTLNNKVVVTGDYKGSKNKIDCCCPTCNFQWRTTPGHLLRGEGCPRCYGKIKRTLESFIDDLRIVNPNVSVKSDNYVNNITKVTVQCKICNHEWRARPSNLLSGYGCPICGKLKSGQKKRHTHEQFLKKLQDRGFTDIKVLDQYVNAKTKLKFKCIKCGNEWTSRPDSFLTSNGCKYCSN